MPLRPVKLFMTPWNLEVTVENAQRGQKSPNISDIINATLLLSLRLNRRRFFDIFFPLQPRIRRGGRPSKDISSLTNRKRRRREEFTPPFSPAAKAATATPRSGRGRGRGRGGRGASRPTPSTSSNSLSPRPRLSIRTPKYILEEAEREKAGTRSRRRSNDGEDDAAKRFYKVEKADAFADKGIYCLCKKPYDPSQYVYLLSWLIISCSASSALLLCLCVLSVLACPPVWAIWQSLCYCCLSQ